MYIYILRVYNISDHEIQELGMHDTGKLETIIIVPIIIDGKTPK